MKRDAKSGQILPGPGNGRPKGSRNKLSAHIIEDCLENWRKNGRAALEITFKENTPLYLRTMVSILPRELLIEAGPLEDMSDEEFIEIVALMKRLKGERADAVKEEIIKH